MKICKRCQHDFEEHNDDMACSNITFGKKKSKPHDGLILERNCGYIDVVCPCPHFLA